MKFRGILSPSGTMLIAGLGKSEEGATWTYEFSGHKNPHGHRDPEREHAVGAAQGDTFLFSDILELRAWENEPAAFRASVCEYTPQFLRMGFNGRTNARMTSPASAAITAIIRKNEPLSMLDQKLPR